MCLCIHQKNSVQSAPQQHNACYVLSCGAISMSCNIAVCNRCKQQQHASRPSLNTLSVSSSSKPKSTLLDCCRNPAEYSQSDAAFSVMLSLWYHDSQMTLSVTSARCGSARATGFASIHQHFKSTIVSPGLSPADLTGSAC